MRASTESWPGRIALMVAHCVGMIDLVALPVWVGALIGAVLSSLFFAPRFNRLDFARRCDRGIWSGGSRLFSRLVRRGLRDPGDPSRHRRRFG